MNATIQDPSNDTHAARPRTLVWILLAVAWALVLCFALDPRPLAAPLWARSLVQWTWGTTGPVARVIASLCIRLGGVGVLGALVMLASGERGFTRRALPFLVCAPVLALLVMWVHAGYLPIRVQAQLLALAAFGGALAGLALRRSWKAAAALALLIGVLYVQLTHYDVDDALDASTRAQVKHLLALAPALPDGDAGFLRLTEQAFTYAADRSRGSDPVLQNKAAVLALALLAGHEKLADLAGRVVDVHMLPTCEHLRAHLTLQQRPDWLRHFCVSAGLTVLKNDDRSASIGILKEMKDANAGGSGFSFADLAADLAGNRLALAATRDASAARSLQQRARSGLVISDLFPDVHDLPEGIHVDEFQKRYGGAGGAGADSLMHVIAQRLDGCAALR